MWGRRMWALIFYENSKITTRCWTTINRRMLDLTKKRYPTSFVQGQRRSPSKIVGGVKQHLETNTIPARDAQRVQTKPCVHQDPETPQRLTRPVWVSCTGMSQQWPASRALGAATWSHSLWHKPSWRRSPLTPHRAAEQTTHKLQNNYTKEILALLRKF